MAVLIMASIHYLPRQDVMGSTGTDAPISHPLSNAPGGTREINDKEWSRAGCGHHGAHSNSMGEMYFQVCIVRAISLLFPTSTIFNDLL